MPNELVNILGLVGTPGSALDIEDLIRNPRGITPAEEAKRKEYWDTLEKQSEPVTPKTAKEASDLPRWAQILQHLGSVAGDAMTSYAAGINPRGNILPSRHVEALRQRRQRRAQELTEAEQHTQDIELKKEQIAAGRSLAELEERQGIRQKLGAEARAEARWEKQFAAKKQADVEMAELHGRIDAENIRLREAGRDDTAKRMTELMLQGRQQVFAWVKNPPEGMDVNQMREELEFILETEGVYGPYRMSVMDFFDKKIAGPAKEASDLEYAQIADAVVDSEQRTRRMAERSGVTQGGFVPAWFGGGRSR